MFVTLQLFDNHKVISICNRVTKLLAKLIYDDFSERYGIITISDIEITADLKNAKIYISMLDEIYKDVVLLSLNKNTKKYQHYLGKHLKIKFGKINVSPFLMLPEMIFFTTVSPILS